MTKAFLVEVPYLRDSNYGGNFVQALHPKCGSYLFFYLCRDNLIDVAIEYAIRCTVASSCDGADIAIHLQDELRWCYYFAVDLCNKSQSVMR